MYYESYICISNIILRSDNWKENGILTQKGLGSNSSPATYDLCECEQDFNLPAFASLSAKKGSSDRFPLPGLL